MTNSIKCFRTFIPTFWVNHIQIWNLKPSLGPRGQRRLFAQKNLNTVTAVCSKAGVGQTAGGAKELVKAAGGTKELLSKLLSAQNAQTFVCRQQLWPEFFCATTSFDHSSFVPPAVWPLVLRKASNFNFGCKLLKKNSYKVIKHLMLLVITFGSIPNTIIKNIGWTSSLRQFIVDFSQTGVLIDQAAWYQAMA